MNLGIADDGCAAAVTFHEFTLGNRLNGVVGPFAVDVRLQQREEPADIVVGKYNDVLHTSNSIHELRAVRGGKNRTPRSLQRANGSIVIDRDNQAIRLGRCALQVPDVPDMKDVKASIGEGDRSSSGSVTAHELDQFSFGDNHRRVSERLELPSR